MEKKMQKPEMEIIHFDVADIIVASGGIAGPSEEIEYTDDP